MFDPQTFTVLVLAALLVAMTVAVITVLVFQRRDTRSIVNGLGQHYTEELTAAWERQQREIDRAHEEAQRLLSQLLHIMSRPGGPKVTKHEQKPPTDGNRDAPGGPANGSSEQHARRRRDLHDATMGGP